MTTDRSSAIREFISRPLYDEGTLLARDARYPKISIVIPSYNKGEFIEKTILSVLNQNYPNLECIVIDGGSTDHTMDIIKKYERFIAYWVSEKDSGQSEALNKGFARATGELVNEQDADDIFLPDAFHKVAELYGKYPRADIIFGNRLDIDEHDHVIGEIKYTRFSRWFTATTGCPSARRVHSGKEDCSIRLACTTRTSIWPWIMNSL